MKRNELRVWVVSPTGEEVEATRRNANDLVSNLGWKYRDEPVFTENPLAQASRSRIPREKKMDEVRKLAADKASEVDGASEPVEKKRGRPKKAKVASELSADTDEELIPYDTAADLDDELADLEREEASRSPNE